MSLLSVKELGTQSDIKKRERISERKLEGIGSCRRRAVGEGRTRYGIEVSGDEKAPSEKCNYGLTDRPAERKQRTSVLRDDGDDDLSLV